MNVDCKSSIEANEGRKVLLAADVREWLSELPDGAVLSTITRDFGNQRDPEVRLVGLRASWSETK